MSGGMLSRLLVVRCTSLRRRPLFCTSAVPRPAQGLAGALQRALGQDEGQHWYRIGVASAARYTGQPTAATTCRPTLMCRKAPFLLWPMAAASDGRQNPECATIQANNGDVRWCGLSWGQRTSPPQQTTGCGTDGAVIAAVKGSGADDYVRVG